MKRLVLSSKQGQLSEQGAEQRVKVEFTGKYQHFAREKNRCCFWSETIDFLRAMFKLAALKHRLQLDLLSANCLLLATERFVLGRL